MCKKKTKKTLLFVNFNFQPTLGSDYAWASHGKFSFQARVDRLLWLLDLQIPFHYHFAKRAVRQMSQKFSIISSQRPSRSFFLTVLRRYISYDDPNIFLEFFERIFWLVLYLNFFPMRCWKGASPEFHLGKGRHKFNFLNFNRAEGESKKWKMVLCEASNFYDGVGRGWRDALLLSDTPGAEQWRS